MPFSLLNWFLRKKIGAHLRYSGRPMEHRRVVNPYHAVGISPGPQCCGRAVELKGKRFLATAAPKIPLRNCDSKSCRCHYIHFDDRRSGEDRRERANEARGNGLNERRLGQGRRDTD